MSSPRSGCSTAADPHDPVLVIANHFLWFKHFSEPQLPDDHPYSANFGANTLKGGSPYDYSDPYRNRLPTFTEISSFFGICVWMVPFALFVSLSASDNVLPTSAEIGSGPALGGAGGERRVKGQGMAKMVVSSVKDYFSTSGEALGLWTGSRHERFD